MVEEVGLTHGGDFAALAAPRFSHPDPGQFTSPSYFSLPCAWHWCVWWGQPGFGLKALPQHSHLCPAGPTGRLVFGSGLSRDFISVI